MCTSGKIQKRISYSIYIKSLTGLTSSFNNLLWLPPLSEIHLINPWLLGGEGKPVIIRDGNKAVHFMS
jgi:hypothetical protein